MDQVLVNFLGGARKALGKEFNDPTLGTDDDKWQVLAQVPKFWSNLEWMPGAKAVWEFIIPYKPLVLSAAPPADLNPMCGPEKLEWCQRELGIGPERVFIVSRKEKKNYALSPDGPNLLVDDHPKNVNEWRAVGGEAILHSTVQETLFKLQHVLQNDPRYLQRSNRANG
jgi:hypothetical protein